MSGFREFLLRTNALALAVGVIIGGSTATRTSATFGVAV
jgi:large-conductance mechanosensitive channel